MITKYLKIFFDDCNERAIHKNIPYSELVLFIIIFDILPHISGKQYKTTDIYLLSIVGGTMSIFLLAKDYWQETHQKYFAGCWYICVFICLPLTDFIILFKNNFAEWTIISLIISIFILSHIVDWEFFLKFLFLSFFISIVYVTIFNQMDIFQNFISQQGMWALYVLAISISISFIFIRKQEKLYNDSLLKAKNAFGIVCHEIRTPLSTLQLIHSNFSKKNETTSEELKKYSEKFNYLMEDLYYIVDDMITKLQIGNTINLKKMSVNKLLSHAMDEYPFKYNQRNKIEILIKDFIFLGEEKFFKFMLFNIINNSLYYMVQNKISKILIYNDVNESYNILVLEDNGPGIIEEEIINIFRGFYSKKNNGVGLGLFFCKQVMSSFGGNILCESKAKEYTEFKLYFPKIL